MDKVILFIVFFIMAMAVVWLFLEMGRANAGRQYIMPFCQSIQRYRFNELWKTKVREAYNSVTIGMTFEEINKRFKATQESIVLQDTVEVCEIPPDMKTLFFYDSFLQKTQSDSSIKEYMNNNEEEFKTGIAKATELIKKEAETKIIPVLVSEETLPSGAIKAIYRWDLNIEYVTSQTDVSGVVTTHGTDFTHGRGFNYNYDSKNSSVSSGYSSTNLNAVTQQNAHSTTTEKSYIQMTFEDGKMVKREQKGLFEI